MRILNSNFIFLKPEPGLVPPLRYGLPFLPALPSGASWQILVKPGIQYHSYRMTALTKEATVDKSIITGQVIDLLADRLSVSP